MKKIRLILACSLMISLITSTAWATSFADTDKHWAKPSIDWAVEKNIATGYPDGTFQPNKHVTEAEFLAMMIRLYPNAKQEYEFVYQNNHYENWYDPYYDVAKKFNMPVGLYTKAINRGQVAQMIAGAFL
ncbi:S-layer homology domain-containing protein [Brevibacillus borstelensis]|uniref:S-layer homology domain-containing protein n=1 Tax=Brevibacillus borstelensis TaxID=45462 RepID=UPI003CE5BDD1